MKCSRLGRQSRQTKRSRFVTQVLCHFATMLVKISWCLLQTAHGFGHFPDTARNRTLTLFRWHSKRGGLGGCVQESPADIEKPHTPTVVSSQNKQHFVNLWSRSWAIMRLLAPFCLSTKGAQTQFGAPFFTVRTHVKVSKGPVA